MMRASCCCFAANWQDSAAAVTQDGSIWQWFAALGREPGVVEVLLAVTIVTAVVTFWWRLATLVRDARSRQSLGDYLLGVEQALHGDLEGAHRRLQSVVSLDPQNHYARLLLGKVLAERGEPEQAHQQHICLKAAFGIDSAANDLLLASSLLGAGLGREAADAAQRALAKEPNHAAGWEFVYRARLQSGDFEAAAQAGRRLLQLISDPPRAARLRADLAATFASAGNAQFLRGDAGAATSMLEQARRAAPAANGVQLLATRLDAQRHGLDRAVATLLQEAPASGSGTSSLLPTQQPVAVVTPRGLPVATLQGLASPMRWRCRACGTALPGEVAECSRCGARAPGELLEPALVNELDSPAATMDAIDVNDAYVHRLVQGLLESKQKARQELLELRDRAVPELLRAAWHLGDSGQQPCIDVLRAMGPTIAPALFAASDTLTAERLLPIGSRSPAALVGRVVQGFDRAALPHVEPLFASAKAEHRKILIDFFLGLADLEQFQLVLERFPPIEILHRLNKAEAVVLQRFLRAVPKGHFVAESLLREPTFYRDEDVLAAIPGAPEPEVLLGVLRARGGDSAATEMLLAALRDPELAAVAEQVLADLGAPVLEHVLAAFADPERSAAERQRLQNLLVRGGAPAAALLANGFGPEPTAADDELRSLLARIGDVAVPPLQAAYEHSGWLEKVSIGLISRHTNRRVQIVMALRAVGSAPALAALRALLDGERDANLRLRLQQALHGGGDGQGR